MDPTIIIALFTEALKAYNNAMAGEPKSLQVATWLVVWNGFKQLLLPRFPKDQQTIILSLESQWEQAQLANATVTPATPTATK